MEDFHPDSPEIRFALEAVRKAAELTEWVRLNLPKTSIVKKDASPVTLADFSAQALVAKKLSEVFPDDGFLAEEDSAMLENAEGRAALEKIRETVSRFTEESSIRQVTDWIDHRKNFPLPRRFWTLDPIDGTKGFIRGDQYAVALALVEGGKVRIGVLGCPNLKEAHFSDPGGPGTLAVAVRGRGAWFSRLKQSSGSFKPLHVSNQQDASKAVILRSVEAAHTDGTRTGKLMKAMGIQGPPVHMDSLAKYAVLAAGVADLLVRFPPPENPGRSEFIWDQAAGTLLVEEAGGRVSDLDGKELDYSQGRLLAANRGVLLTNGWLHESALGLLRRLNWD